uniref:ATP-binding cassette domain-containing protein n=1 Tax=Rhodothermus marinus TaxID=29549 RepID=UPI000B13737B
MALLTIEHLTKRFGTVTVLQDVSCTVAPGESVALWGPNGAGKTTLLRCVLGVLPFEGTIRIDSLDVRRQGKEARRLVGFVPQEVTFYPTLTVGETAAFFARLRGLEPDEAQRRLAQVALEDRLD